MPCPCVYFVCVYFVCVWFVLQLSSSVPQVRPLNTARDTAMRWRQRVVDCCAAPTVLTGRAPGGCVSVGVRLLPIFGVFVVVCLEPYLPPRPPLHPTLALWWWP